MAKEYIGRSEALKIIHDVMNLWANLRPDAAAGLPTVYQRITQIPAADAVDVVRCKDCIHHENGYCHAIRSLFDGDSDLAPGISTMVAPDHFCGWGERRK